MRGEVRRRPTGYSDERRLSRRCAEKHGNSKSGHLSDTPQCMGKGTGMGRSKGRRKKKKISLASHQDTLRGSGNGEDFGTKK